MSGHFVLISALAALLLFPPGSLGAAGERPEYELELECGKSVVSLGEEIPLEIVLEKKRGKPAEVNELRLARNSISIRVERAGRVHTVTRTFGHEARAPDGQTYLMKDDPPPRMTLRRGKGRTFSFPLLAIVPGRIEVTAVYRGLSKGPEEVLSNPVTVTVAPEEGKTEIAAVMETSKGALILSFFPEKAFNTTYNFLSLAKAGRYDGLTFHRIVKGFLIQGGDPKGNGTGGPGWHIPAEFHAELKHVPGVISMARASAPGSAGSQFFIMHGTRDHLDGKSAAFGKVVEGMDVVEALANVEVVRSPHNPKEESKPVEPPIIKSVRVITR